LLNVSRLPSSYRLAGPNKTVGFKPFLIIVNTTGFTAV
jgi:hypothetical protein